MTKLPLLWKVDLTPKIINSSNPSICSQLVVVKMKSKFVNFVKKILIKNDYCHIADCFFKVLKRSGTEVKKLEDIVECSCEKECCAQLAPDYAPFIRLLLTIPRSSCTNEWSFSTLKRVKTYLRSAMLQKRLNHIFIFRIFHIYAKMINNLDIDLLLNEFIERNLKKTATFTVVKKLINNYASNFWMHNKY